MSFKNYNIFIWINILSLKLEIRILMHLIFNTSFFYLYYKIKPPLHSPSDLNITKEKKLNIWKIKILFKFNQIKIIIMNM